MLLKEEGWEEKVLGDIQGIQGDEELGEGGRVSDQELIYTYYIVFIGKCC